MKRGFEGAFGGRAKRTRFEAEATRSGEGGESVEEERMRRRLDPCAHLTQEGHGCFVNFQAYNGSDCSAYCLDECDAWIDEVLLSPPTRVFAKGVLGDIVHIEVELNNILVECDDTVFLIPSIIVLFNPVTKTVQITIGTISGNIAYREAVNLVCHYLSSAAGGFLISLRLRFFEPGFRSADDVTFGWQVGLGHRDRFFQPNTLWTYVPSSETTGVMSLRLQPPLYVHEPTIALCDRFVSQYLSQIGHENAVQLHQRAVAQFQLV